MRQRDQSWLEARKLVIRDLATRPSFALDDDGSTYLIGGTAVVPADPLHAEPLLAYLNSELASWYLRAMTPSFRSGFQKFEPRHLSRIPVPLKAITTPSIRATLTETVRSLIAAKDQEDERAVRLMESRLESVICRAAGVDLAEIERCHR